MKFALHFANIAFPDGGGAKAVARAAEAAGFESIVAVEHVVIPTDYASIYPYGETGKLPGGPGMAWPDPLTWLTFVAAATARLRLLTGVLILAQRNPVVLAKQLATLDHMSGGRLMLGVGIGWLREEFEAIGVPFERRGARVDDYIAAMRALWDGDDASHDGAFLRFANVSCNPKPAQGRVPIIIGGHSPAAARRAGRLGDGFFPATGAREDMRPVIDRVRQQAAAAGRDPASVEVTTGCPEALPGAGGDPLAAVETRRAAGIARLAIPVTAFMPDWQTGLARFGEEVIAPSAR